MPFALVNTAQRWTSAPISSMTIPATTIGNLLLLMASWDASGTATITGGATWIGGNVQLDSPNNQNFALWWAICSSSVTSIGLGSMGGAAFVAAEFSGIPGSGFQDQTDATKAIATAQDFTSTVLSTANQGSQTGQCHTSASEIGTIQMASFFAASGSNELIIGGFGGSGGGAPTITATGVYTLAIAEPGNAGQTGSAALIWREAGAGGIGIQPGTKTWNFKSWFPGIK